MPYKNKKLIIFDLDGTLTESKSPIKSGMCQELNRLLAEKLVAIISGCKFEQFKKQILRYLRFSNQFNDKLLSRLYILPTNGAGMWQFDNGWKNEYQENLSNEECEEIIEKLKKAIDESKVKKSAVLWGEQFENRGSQITFSALGQEAPLVKKIKWDPDKLKRYRIQKMLSPRLPQYTIQIGGTTSIDITKQGIDKAYGIKKLSKYLDISICDMLFIGDSLQKGGNDAPVKRTGIDWLSVHSAEETKKIIQKIL